MGQDDETLPVQGGDALFANDNDGGACRAGVRGPLSRASKQLFRVPPSVQGLRGTFDSGDIMAGLACPSRQVFSP